MSSLIDWIYPIGAVVASVNKQFDPNKLYTGTWVRFAKGRTLVGVNESDSDFSSAGKTGGEKTHTLTVAEMPSHSHTSKGYYTYWDGTHNTNYHLLLGDGSEQKYSSNSAGGGGAHNNLQPYQTVYYWTRTA